MADRSFELRRELGDGAFGTVYLADMVSIGGFRKSVAIKLLKRDWDGASDAGRRLRDEARLLGRLRHRHIVAVDDLIRLDGRWAVVMEYVPGVDLQAIIDAAAAAGERVPPAAALEITAAVAQALDAAWNGRAADGGEALRVVHRDIKPGNIRLTSDGDVKVLDFGIARADFQGREARTDRIRYGSIGYMAPERLLGDPEVPAGDIYALGVVLWELLCLECYGRTELAPERAADQLRARLDHARTTLGPGSDGVLELIADCMDYAVGARPAAATVAERARRLSRQLPGPDLMAFARDFVPRVADAASGTVISPRQLTEERSDSATFHFDEADGGATAAPLTGDFGPPAAAPRPAPAPAEAGTLAHALGATGRPRRSPAPAIAAVVAILVFAGGLALWARGRSGRGLDAPTAIDARPPPPGRGVVGAPAPAGPPPGKEAAKEADAGSVSDISAGGAAAGAAGATPPDQAPAEPDDDGRAATPGSPVGARTSPPAAASGDAAGTEPADAGRSSPLGAAPTPSPASRASTGAARVDRAKFLVPGASRVEVECQGVVNDSSSSSVYVKDFPAGSCRVHARVDGAAWSGVVSVQHPAGFTCTPTGATLSCEAM